MSEISPTMSEPVANSDGEVSQMGWRAVAARDQTQRTQDQEESGPSPSLLKLRSTREAVERLGWRGAQQWNGERPEQTEGWRAYTLSEANVAERDRERREKMNRRSEQRARKAEAARESWAKRAQRKHRDLVNDSISKRSNQKTLTETRRQSKTPTCSALPPTLPHESLGDEVTRGTRGQERKSRRSYDKQKRGRRERPPINGEWLKNAGLRYLARFNASEQHFRSILHQKIKKADSRETEDTDVHQTWVDAAVKFALEYGGLDDERFAMGLARSLKRRGLARGAARLKMRQKKLGADQIEAALTANYTVTAESDVDPSLFAAARAAKKKRIGPWGPTEVDYPTLQKQLAKLARRGFSYSIAQRVLKASLDEAEDWLLRGDL